MKILFRADFNIYDVVDWFRKNASRKYIDGTVAKAASEGVLQTGYKLRDDILLHTNINQQITQAKRCFHHIVADYDSPYIFYNEHPENATL